MLLAGVPLHVVAARVGDRLETVLATYAHLLPSSDAMAAEAMATVRVNKIHQIAQRPLVVRPEEVVPA
jgi:hypothetical protein